VKRLKDFAQNRAVSGAVSGQPDPPARPCIPVESAPVRPCVRLRACARAGVNADATQLRLPTDAPLRRLP
jgi:hypothetical protein